MYLWADRKSCHVCVPVCVRACMQVWWQTTSYNKEAARKAAYVCRDEGPSSYANMSVLLVHMTSSKKPDGEAPQAEHDSEVGTAADGAHGSELGMAADGAHDTEVGMAADDVLSLALRDWGSGFRV